MRISKDAHLLRFSSLMEQAATSAKLTGEQQQMLREAMRQSGKITEPDIREMLKDPHRLIEQYLRWKSGPQNKRGIPEAGAPGLHGTLNSIDVDVSRVFKRLGEDLVSRGRPGLRLYVKREPFPRPGSRQWLEAGSYSASENAIELNKALFEYTLSKVEGTSPDQRLTEAQKVDLATSVLSTTAHEVTHSVMRRVKSASPFAYAEFVDRTFSLDLDFRKRVLSKINEILRPLPGADVDYLAGDPEAIQEVYGDLDRDHMAGEFIAEIGSLILLNQVLTHEVPEDIRSTCAAIAARTQAALGELRDLIVQDPGKPPGQAGALADLCEAIEWAMAPDFNGRDKPRWLQKLPQPAPPDPSLLRGQKDLRDLMRWHLTSRNADLGLVPAEAVPPMPPLKEFAKFARYFDWMIDGAGKMVGMSLTREGERVSRGLWYLEPTGDFLIDAFEDGSLSLVDFEAVRPEDHRGLLNYAIGARRLQDLPKAFLPEEPGDFVSAEEIYHAAILGEVHGLPRAWVKKYAAAVPRQQSDTPLHRAAEHQTLDEFMDVITPEMLMVHDGRGQTPVHIAARTGAIKVIAPLLTTEMLMLRDKFGFTPLEIARDCGTFDDIPETLRLEPRSQPGLAID